MLEKLNLHHITVLLTWCYSIKSTMIW